MQLRTVVEYESGLKALVETALLTAGGQIRHKFDDLSGITATLHREAPAAIEPSPDPIRVEADAPRHPRP